jgi:hypothetical protein
MGADYDVEAPRAWRVIGLSAPGVSHLKTNTPCQDEFCFRTGGDWMAIAVADGAGSAERSKEGAHAAACASIDFLTGRLDGQMPDDTPACLDLMAETFQSVRATIVSLAETAGERLDRFATTLSCVIATDRHVAVGQIGDGLVVAKQEMGELFTAIAPDRGEYTNETSFITSADALARTRFLAFRQRVTCVAATTDGLLRLAVTLPDYSPYPSFFEPLFAFARSDQALEEQHEALHEFLTSDRVCARTDDDKTLVLAVR